MGPLVGGRVEPLGPLGQGLLGPSGITVEGQLKQGLVSIAPFFWVGNQILVTRLENLLSIFFIQEIVTTGLASSVGRA